MTETGIILIWLLLQMSDSLLIIIAAVLTIPTAVGVAVIISVAWEYLQRLLDKYLK